MSWPSNLTQIKAVAEVRALQRSVAEASFTKAQVDVRQIEERQGAAQIDLTDREAAWLESVSGGLLRLEFSRGWAGAMLEGRQALELIGEELDQGCAVLGDRTAELSRASAAEQGAAQLQARAVRQQTHRVEERALNEATDAFLRRWSR